MKLDYSSFNKESMRKQLILQRNRLLFQKQKDVHTLQYLLWYNYFTKPIYTQKKSCIDAIEVLAKLMHNPSQPTTFFSNGDLRHGEILIKPAVQNNFVQVRLPKQTKEGSLVSCRPQEGEYLSLLYETLRVLPI
tara:strand:+ start:1279 stop:1680 length:402 start_codon:yes stop_codon:yes gene_type:complete